MKYILDSNVALKWVLPETDSAKALQLRDDYRNLRHAFSAPSVFPIEVGHALTRAERANRIIAPSGWALWQSVMADAPRMTDYFSLMPRAYEISSQMRIGIYDCLYVALAEQEKCGLITSDVRLKSALGTRFPIVLLDSI